MIIEQRDYLMVPGGVAPYLEKWWALGRDAQVRHLGEPVAVLTTEVGELNTLVYLWRFTDTGDRATRRAALAADPDFAAFRATVRGLVTRQTNRLLTIQTPPTEGR